MMCQCILDLANSATGMWL